METETKMFKSMCNRLDVELKKEKDKRTVAERRLPQEEEEKS